VDVDGAAAVLAEQLVIDETRDVVYWQAPGAEPRQTGLHDYGALYAVSGLYEAVYLVRLGVRSPQLLAEVLASVCPSVRRAQLQVLDVGAGTGCVGAALSAAGFRRSPAPIWNRPASPRSAATAGTSTPAPGRST